MKRSVLLLLLAVVAAVLVAGVGTGSAYNEGSCTTRVTTRDNSPLYTQAHADVTCDEVVPAIRLTVCLYRSTLGPIINFLPVSCESFTALNVRYRGVYASHICTGTSRWLYRTEAFTMVTWPSGLGTSNTAVSGSIGANCK